MKHSIVKRILTPGILTTAVVMTLLIGFLIPIIQTNNVESFADSVAKQDAAFKVLDSRAGDFNFFPKIRITNVEFTPSGENCSNPNVYTAYIVKSKEVGFFGITLKTHTDDMCTGS
jgi:hypothetical protein